MIDIYHFLKIVGTFHYLYMKIVSGFIEMSIKRLVGIMIVKLFHNYTFDHVYTLIESDQLKNEIWVGRGGIIWVRDSNFGTRITNGKLWITNGWIGNRPNILGELDI